MSLRLVRQSSDTPNISNHDDTCMVRYAYGGYNGIVKNFGAEITASIDTTNRTITLHRGRVVLYGWEVDIDTEILTIPSSVDALRYDFLYLEINLLQESTELKIVRSAENVEPLSIGDDLTTNPSGIARIALYSWHINGAAVSNLTRIAPMIRRLSEIYEEVDARLVALGFKQGNIPFLTDIAPDNLNHEGKNPLYRQGNYVIGSYGGITSKEFPIHTADQIDLDAAPEFAGSGKYWLIGVVPDHFYPSQTVRMRCELRLTTGVPTQAVCWLRPDGRLVTGTLYIPISTAPVLQGVSLTIGYKAAPIPLT